MFAWVPASLAEQTCEESAVRRNHFVPLYMLSPAFLLSRQTHPYSARKTQSKCHFTWHPLTKCLILTQLRALLSMSFNCLPVNFSQ